MKKTTLFRVFSFVLLIGLMASCSKHTDKPVTPGGGTDDGGGPQAENYYVKTKMDGQPANFSDTVKAMRSVDNAAPFHINITEITDKHVKGTFSGAFFDGEGGDGANEKEFTEGEFEAPIQ